MKDIYFWPMIWKRWWYHNTRFIVKWTPLLNKQIKLEHIVPKIVHIVPPIHSHIIYIKNLHVAHSSSLIICQNRSLTININTIRLCITENVPVNWIESLKGFWHPRLTYGKSIEIYETCITAVEQSLTEKPSRPMIFEFIYAFIAHTHTHNWLQFIC